MKEMSRIMACVDLSDYSIEIIESALTLARGSGIELLLLNVFSRRDIDAVQTVSPHVADKFNLDSYLNQVKEERLQSIQEMLNVHFFEDKDQIKILVRVGTPYKVILDTIAEEKVDLVVIASKGKSNLLGTLHGSNAEKVFRHSSVPVLSVRNRERFNLNRSNRNR